jgi:aromatic amino acid aminotransferase I
VSFDWTLFPRFVKDLLVWFYDIENLVQTVAPGSRLGWFTCNPMFAERLERFAEISTEGPSGFSQVRDWSSRFSPSHILSSL